MIRFKFIWYDLWIGLFIDKKKKLIYFCPLPCCVFIISYSRQIIIKTHSIIQGGIYYFRSRHRIDGDIWKIYSMGHDNCVLQNLRNKRKVYNIKMEADRLNKKGLGIDNEFRVLSQEPL